MMRPMLKTVLLGSLVAAGGWALLWNWHPDRTVSLPQTPSVQTVLARKHSARRHSPRQSIRAESREVTSKNASPSPVSPGVRISRAELLRACDAYGFEQSSHLPNQQYLSDRALLLQEVDRRFPENAVHLRDKDYQEEWITDLCQVEWQRNLQEAQAVERRLYGSYAPYATYYPR